MADINITTVLQGRKSARQQKMKRISDAYAPKKVRVIPKNDSMRRMLVHPNGMVKFRDTGSREWPLDQWTLRRLREGSVTIEEAAAVENKEGRGGARKPEPPKLEPPKV